jgi:predicted nucleotidyltransferase
MNTEDRFDEEIKNIVDQLIRVYKPERIILFGSLVDGKIWEGTDIDLFIIKKDIPNLGVDRIRQLDGLIKYGLATDFIVYKPEEVEKRLKLGDPFIKSIISEGKVLYDAE